MRKLSDMYQEYQDPYDTLKAIASNDIVHTTKDLVRLQKMLNESTPMIGGEATEDQKSMVKTFATNFHIAYLIKSWGRNPGDVKRWVYIHVEKILKNYEYEGYKCSELHIFKIMYGPIGDVLTEINDYTVYARWRLDIGQ